MYHSRHAFLTSTLQAAIALRQLPKNLTSDLPLRVSQLSSHLLRTAWAAALALSLWAGGACQTGAQHVIAVWPEGRGPGDTLELPAEGDQSKPNEGLVAGRPVIRLGNVTHPELVWYPAPADKATDVAVVICPGGGHRILAWDLEGTEVAQWLNSLGIHAGVLKYRVPARPDVPRYHVAVQDAQRALSLVRSRAAELGVAPQRIGILGFSAGGETAALATLLPERLYAQVDDSDAVAWKPDFSLLIYPAYLTNADSTALQPYVQVTADAPRTFFAHAADDPVVPQSSVLLWLELKRHKVPAELHVYSQGGHGYGLRRTERAVTAWPEAAAAWLRAEQLLPAQ
jgi:acetyl esterase/lipase